MEEDGARRLRTWDLDISGGQVGPMVVPGTYAARLTAAGRTLEDIRAQVALSLTLRDNLEEMGKMIDRLEWIRKQVEDLQQLNRVESDAQAVAEAAAAFRSPMQLYGRMGGLGSDVGRYGTDFALPSSRRCTRCSSRAPTRPRS